MKKFHAFIKLPMILALIVLLAFAATATQAQDVIHTASGNCFDVVWNQTQLTLDITYKWSGGSHWGAYVWYSGGYWRQEGTGWVTSTGGLTMDKVSTYTRTGTYDWRTPSVPTLRHGVHSRANKTWLDLDVITTNWMCSDKFWLGDRSGPPS